MSKCEYCNNELTSRDSPLHVGICNKCYANMFTSSDKIIDTMTSNIAQLQHQLKQRDKQLKDITFKYNIVCENSNLLNKEIVELSNKLKSQRKDIIDKIKEKAQYSKHGYMGPTQKGYYSLYAGILDDILKEYED